MVIILGKTSSGKDTIVNRLLKYGYSKQVTYTTRPRRKREIPDKTYHFITKEDFQQKIEERFFAEYKSYNTAHGVWYYGSALKDYEKADDKTVIILTPDGYRDVISKLKRKPKTFYIHSDNDTIRERLRLRGDDPEEARRRMEHDDIDFEGVENIVDKVIYNNFDTDIDDIVKEIMES